MKTSTRIHLFLVRLCAPILALCSLALATEPTLGQTSPTVSATLDIDGFDPAYFTATWNSHPITSQFTEVEAECGSLVTLAINLNTPPPGEAYYVTYSLGGQACHFLIESFTWIGYTDVKSPAANQWLIGRCFGLFDAFYGSDFMTWRGPWQPQSETYYLKVVCGGAPKAYDANVMTEEDTPMNVHLTASDPNATTLTYSIVVPPAHGQLSGSAPDLTYTPDPCYSGVDSFSFKVNDGQADSNIATVRITVAPSSVSVTSLDVNSTSVIGGGSPTVTINLSGPAPKCGVDVQLWTEVSGWASLVNKRIAEPLVTSLNSPLVVTVPSGQSSLSVAIETYQVLMPLDIIVKATVVDVFSVKTTEFVLLPDIIPDAGPIANDRVIQIIQYFVGIESGDYQAALSDLVTIRNTSSEGGRDIYAAAADHYLVALTFTLSDSVFLGSLKAVIELGLVPLHEIVKYIHDTSSRQDRPASRPTGLSVLWGQTGVFDAVRIVLGKDVVHWPMSAF